MTAKYFEIENYDAENPDIVLSNDRLKLYYEFLENADYTKFFVWVDFSEHKKFCWSYDNIPKFHGKNFLTDNFRIERQKGGLPGGLLPEAHGS